MMSQDPVTTLIEALTGGTVDVVDLTQPLSERTPVIRLPEEFEQTPGLKVHEISRYDERGPAWAWNWLEIGEHVGTHLDAPVHWITGVPSPRGCVRSMISTAPPARASTRDATGFRAIMFSPLNGLGTPLRATRLVRRG